MEWQYLFSPLRIGPVTIKNRLAFGANCPVTGGIFREGYNFAGPLDKVIPVNAYVVGCPPRPQAIIDGVVALLGTIGAKKKKPRGKKS